MSQKKKLKAEIKRLKKEVKDLEFKLRFSEHAYELLKGQNKSQTKQGSIVEESKF